MPFVPLNFDAYLAVLGDLRSEACATAFYYYYYYYYYTVDNALVVIH